MTTLPTRVGRASGDHNEYFGYSVSSELAGAETVTGLIAMAVTGRRPSEEVRAVLDDIGVVVTVADPRIWPLKLTRLVSAYGRSLPAVAAAYLCVEDGAVGHWTGGTGAARLIELHASICGRVDDREAIAREVERVLGGNGRWMGFGVPFRQEDERVVALRRRLEARGRAGLPYWRLFESVSAVVLELKRLRPNISIAVGAACLDLGFTPRQASLLSVALGQTDYLANAVEGAEQAPEVLRELPAQNVRYVGPPARPSPRFAARK